MSLEWMPTSTKDVWVMRAELLQKIRDFFRKRRVLEVDTPLLSLSTVPDVAIESIKASVRRGSKSRAYYLQTSPEFAMKRMLASGSGSIYQICKAFRQEEVGRFHNPEFTMLEWYRVGFDHHALMDEMDALLQALLGTGRARRMSYEELFLEYFHVNPHTAVAELLAKIAKAHGVHVLEQDDIPLDRDDWLAILLTHRIEPHLGHDMPVFIYDFPETQAALAKLRVRDDGVRVASRFEVYVRGIELANGFHELQDADLQRERFLEALRGRRKLGREEVPLDERFLAALQRGLPDCAGVALGFDRLLMVAMGLSTIRDVLAFPVE